MTKTRKIILISALLLIVAALIFFCVQRGKAPEETPAENPTVATQDALQAAVQLSSAAETAWQNGTAQCITLSDEGSTASAPGVQIAGNTVTVTSSGIYSVSGTLTEGQLAVDCGDTVVLILDGVEISNAADAAIRVADAAHTLIYLPEGSANRLTSGTEQEITAASENADLESAAGAALYAKDSLSIAGSGKLTVGGYINNAVATTDHLTVLGGELELAAVNNGLKGKDSVTVLDGKISIHSGNDGIKSSNEADEACGNIDIRGGEINIVSLGDGVNAEKNLSVAAGSITVSAGDTETIGSRKSVQSFDNMPGGKREAGSMPQPGEAPPDLPDGMEQGSFPGAPGGMTPPDGEAPPDLPDGMEQGGFPGAPGGMTPPDGETPPEIPDSNGERMDAGTFDEMRGQGGMRGDFSDPEETDEASTKGLKCGGDLTVSGGSITVNSVDDCIHANGSITVTGGSFLLRTDDDGFHADDTLTVADGDITVSQSYEGLEGHFIYLNGGNISVTASDDGINARGGSSAMFGGMHAAAGTDDASLPVLKISGGTICVNADGDGLDSNGDLIVEGGTILVDGPTNSGNGALDSGTENGGSILCNGGTILAIGASGMEESFESDSAQCSFIKNFSGTMQAGTQITITDESGKTIFEHKSAKTFNSVVFSSPELVLGRTYTITVGDQTETIQIESISNGTSSGFGMPGGFGEHNGRPEMP